MVYKIEILLPIAVALITGCATSEPTFTSSGQMGHSIDCSGGDSSWGDCYEEAGKLCGARGYRIVERMTDKGSSTFIDEDLLTSGTYNTRTLIIQCR